MGKILDAVKHTWTYGFDGSTSCTGNCTGSCSGSCGGGCQGCTGCSGEACKGSCSAYCASGCSGGCGGSCHVNCTGDCKSGCGGCDNGCSGSCKNGCGGTCRGSCGGCDNGCSSCTGSCAGGCKNECEGKCQETCKNQCGNQCKDNATKNLSSFKINDLNMIKQEEISFIINAIKYEVTRRKETPLEVSTNEGELITSKKIETLIENLKKVNSTAKISIAKDKQKHILKDEFEAIINDLKIAWNEIIDPEL